MKFSHSASEASHNAARCETNGRTSLFVARLARWVNRWSNPEAKCAFDRVIAVKVVGGIGDPKDLPTRIKDVYISHAQHLLQARCQTPAKSLAAAQCPDCDQTRCLPRFHPMKCVSNILHRGKRLRRLTSIK